MRAWKHRNARHKEATMPFSLLKHLFRLAVEKPYRAARRYRIPANDAATTLSSFHYLTTATIVRDEARYIREFVAFHHIVGVDHMLIYLDGGDDGALRAEVKDFIERGFVELIPWPRFLDGRNNQFVAYQHAVAYMRGKCRWLAMIDADEFLFAPASADLKSELRQREQYAALAVYSRTFGTGGVAKILPGKLLTEMLVKRGREDHPKNFTQRAIVNPQAVDSVRSANSVILKDGAMLGWDEDGRPVLATGEAGHGAVHLRINHYFTRSEEDFQHKLARQYFGKSRRSKKMDGKRREAADNSLSAETDRTIHTYLPRLRQLVFKEAARQSHVREIWDMPTAVRRERHEFSETVDMDQA
jgi:hypothetical protein